MHFKILKTSFDGLCGAESRYETLADVLAELSCHRGWPSKKAMHDAVRKWAGSARPGSVFCTQASAIIAMPAESSDREDDRCRHCDHEGLDYSDINGNETGGLEQEVSCPACGQRWTDVFTLAEQKSMNPVRPLARR